MIYPVDRSWLAVIYPGNVLRLREIPDWRHKLVRVTRAACAKTCFYYRKHTPAYAFCQSKRTHRALFGNETVWSVPRRMHGWEAGLWAGLGLVCRPYRRPHARLVSLFSRLIWRVLLPRATPVVSLLHVPLPYLVRRWSRDAVGGA